MINEYNNYDIDHRYQVEAQILGTIMNVDRDTEVRSIVEAHNVRVKDFRLEAHKDICSAIFECYKQNAVPTVVAVGQFRPEKYRLNNYKEFEIELAKVLFAGTYSINTLEHDIFILKQYVIMDFWNWNAHDVLYGNWNGRDVLQVSDNIIAEYNSLFERMTINLKRNETVEENDYNAEIRQKVAKQRVGQSVGVSTTVEVIDDFMSGYSPGELIILAGRPGMGKTTFALISAWETSKLGNPVLFFSLEMPKNQLKSKIISLETKIPYKKIKAGMLTDEELQRVEACSKFIDDSLYFFILDKVTTIEEISRKTEEYVRDKGVKAVFIDYIQRCKSEEGKMDPRILITLISRECKSMAKENYIPVIALSQLNRSVESRHNKRPMLSDLKESGSIEEDADIAVFLYRQAYYDKDLPGATIPYSELFHTEFIFAKGRDLGTTTIHIFLDAIQMTISAYSYTGSYDIIPVTAPSAKVPPPPPQSNQISLNVPDKDNNVPF